MSTTLFVNLPVKDLNRSTEFFAALGFESFGMTEDMASVIISERTQVMLLAESTFVNFVRKDVADATRATEVILVFGLDNPAQVDELVDKAIAAGAGPAGEPTEAGGRYTPAFTDPAGPEWAALCLLQS
jgi:predicted lactoylglutathione lyase